MKNTNLTKILRNMIPPHVKGNVNKKKKVCAGKNVCQPIDSCH